MAMTEAFARFEGPATPFSTWVRSGYARHRGEPIAADRPDLAADLVIAAFPLHEWSAAIGCEKAANSDGLPVCHIGYGPTRIVIGPIVKPAAAPCLRCARLWAPALAEDCAAAPAWPPVIFELVAAQLAAFVDRSRSAQDSDPEGHMLWTDLEMLAQTEHRLVAHPDCDRCHPSEPASPPKLRDEVPVSSESWRAAPMPDRKRLADRLVDGRFGLVRQFERETEAIVHPMTFAAFAGRSDPRRLEIGVGRTGCQAADRDVAMLEALERFSSFEPRGAIAQLSARFGDIEQIAVDPRKFILPGAGQRCEPGYRLASFDPDTPHDWGWAYSLRRRTPVLIPLQLAYYDMPRGKLAPEQRFVMETSNGCALGSSFEEAALFGLFEVLERDAYFTSWYGRFVPGKIRAGTIDDRYAAGMIARLEEWGFEVSILDIGLGFPVTTLAVLAVDDRADAAAASILSTGAHIDPIQALRGALVEVCTRVQHRPAHIVADSRVRAAAMLRDGLLVKTMDDHATLYSHRDSLGRLEFLVAENGANDIGDRLHKQSFSEDRTTNLTDRLVELSEAVLDVADDILVVDLTNSLTASVGLHCVKVLAPGLLPVTFGHQYRRVSAERIAMVDRARTRAAKGGEPCLPHNFQ